MQFIDNSKIRLPKRKEGSHKGDNGSVLVVGGCEDYVGAVTLSGLAALRCGADLVKIIAPEKVAWAINAYSPDIITKKISSKFFLPAHFGIVNSEIKKFDVLLIGNGIGLNKKTGEFCRKTIQRIEKFKVIDADAIKSISADDAKNSIITPHLRELEQFLVNSATPGLIIKKIISEKNTAMKSSLLKKVIQNFLNKNNIMLLKGRIDIIISKDEIFYNKTGNAGMTKGGTGDVLAGLCAGFLAQSKSLLQSAINAAYFNGMIGDVLLKNKMGFTYLASDMVGEIKRIIRL